MISHHRSTFGLQLLMLQLFSQTQFSHDGAHPEVLVYLGNLSISCLFGFACAPEWKDGAWILFRQPRHRRDLNSNRIFKSGHLFNPFQSLTEWTFLRNIFRGCIFWSHIFFSLLEGPSENWDKNKLLYPSVDVLLCARESYSASKG